MQPPVHPRPDAEASPDVLAIGAMTREGFLPTDFAFDRLLPEALRTAGPYFWTHVRAAAMAGAWIDTIGAQRVVDIGSGVGKLCIVAALRSRASYVGLEHRAKLVRVARELTDAFGLGDRVTYVEGAFGEVTLPAADVYYLYNPFAENTFSPAYRLDDDVVLDRRRFARDTKAVERLLRAAPVGTSLLTYNGYGGCIPTSFQLVREDASFASMLRLWTKTGADDHDLWHAPEPA